MKPIRLVQDAIKFEDIYDYAVFRGMKEASEGRPLNVNAFRSATPLSLECHDLYRMGYTLEKESYALRESSTFVTQSTVFTWDDLSGWGKLHINGSKVDFDYRSLEGEEWIEAGDSVSVLFKFDGPDIRVVKVSKG